MFECLSNLRYPIATSNVNCVLRKTVRMYIGGESNTLKLENRKAKILVLSIILDTADVRIKQNVLPIGSDSNLAPIGENREEQRLLNLVPYKWF